MYPLKFEDIFKTVVWGGEKIAPFKGVQTEQHNIGESWELSGVKGNESVVANGPLAGHTITELACQYKETLLGKKVYETTGTEFPLLIKFIDARDDLSVQVHPDDTLAGARHNGSKGKTEMWYVVQADEGAHLMAGLSRQTTPQEYESKVNDNTVTEILKDYKVREGDTFFIPAGRVHSIGKGCFIAEIQQTSDIPYRIYDFGRLGLDGKPRELHTELAKDAIDYTVLDDYRTHYPQVTDSENTLVSCKYFTTSLFDLSQSVTKDIASLDSFLIAICIDGQGTISDGHGNTIQIRKGETILLPADSLSATFTPDGSMKLLACHL